MNARLADYHDRETLPGGQRLRLRAIRPSDRSRLREEFLKLSKATVRDRFFAIKQDLTPAELKYLTEVDFEHHVALVAELETDTGLRPVAVGRLVRRTERPDHSEIAITVVDEMQGKGIGKVMLDRLIGCAREIGVSRVDASVLAENTRMLKLIGKTGLAFESSLEDGIRTISVSL
jgi:GNAT superfamily N-acetyltransferase